MKRDKVEPVQVECPQCRYTEIIYIPIEEMPRCPKCGIRMVIRELLDEGKST
jgi:predicted nucleic-acid-binding Zn-ribbon protein